MENLSLSPRRAAAVGCCSVVGVLIGHSSASAAKPALVRDTKVIVHTLSEARGQPAWRQAIFQGLEAGVSPVDHGLGAYVDQSNGTGTEGLTIQFYTTNGGRNWRVVKGDNF